MLLLSARHHLAGTPVLSVQDSDVIGFITDFVVDPDTLKILAFRLGANFALKNKPNLLAPNSIREYSSSGFVIDSADELFAPDDVVKIKKILTLDFSPLGLRVVTRRGTKLGHVDDFLVTEDDFITQQLIIKHFFPRNLLSSELLIPRSEIVEINDYTIIVKDEEKTIKERAMNEDFIPNFVNPFRNPKPAPSPTRTKNPAAPDN